MKKPRVKKKASRPSRSSSLMVRMDEDSKSLLTQAAELRQISVSDYVRTVTLAQARRELLANQSHTFVMSADDQLAFWNALNQPVVLTESQRKLGAIMRGEM